MKQADTPDTVFRLGRRPDPWAWPDWASAEIDGTFGNRFDDPQGIYRVLYASTQRLATFVECLAYFRPDPEVIAELEKIVGDDGDHEPPPAGVVPREWIGVRRVGAGALVGDYVDIGHHQTIAELRTELAARVVHHGLHDLDAAAIRLTAPRAFTQDISRYVFDRSIDGARQWNGIAYRSKHGDDLTNWAIFEPTSPNLTEIGEFDERDSDLASALQLHGLALG
ncbi:MAG: hypothetical protein JWN67_3873 [Actinomycetia bacterium]|nr:hypothetical protein [Actinomycetes bacterium]